LITPTAVRVYDVTNPPRFPPAATPGIAPGTETFKKTVNMLITCSTPNSTIYYTLDGSNPTTASAIFPQPAGSARKNHAKPLKINSTTTVKAMSVAPNYDQSAIATAVYTKVSKPPRK
jgi:hypothetical protein